MKMKSALLLALVFSLIGATPAVRAQTTVVEGAPAYVDYQGTVYDGTNTAKPLGSLLSGSSYIAEPTNFTMQFRIYSAQTGGTLIYAEAQTVTVSLGQFSVRLGSGAPIAGLTPAPTKTSIAEAFLDKERYLELTVVPTGSAAGTPITPRLAFQSSPFSFVAQRAKAADSVNGVVTATAGSSFTGTVNATGGSFTGTVNATGGSFTGTVNASGANITGANYSGNGSGLTGLTAGQIPSLDASKINSGTLAPERIPSLDASKISSGTLADARLSVNVPTKNNNNYFAYLTQFGKTQFFDTAYFSNSVGIGTSTPSYPLEVVSSVSKDLGGGFWYAFTTGAAIAAGGSHINSISIKADAGIQSAQGLYVTSDRRIKKNLSKSDPELDLELFNQLQVTDYNYVDDVSYGDIKRKGFIAQEVEKIFPQAVNRHLDVVPDIYKSAQCKDGWVVLATDLKKGDRVRLIAEKAEGVYEVLEVASDRFRTDFKPEGNKLIVFGREVKDFRALDYNAISVLNVSASQQIKKEKDAEVKALQEENAVLKAALASQDKRVSTLEAQDRARDARMASIEKRLGASEQPAARTISLKQGE